MDESDDRQLLNQYLLGTLAESEIERLDQLSVTDDQFAARLGDAENDLVDAYVRQEMTGETLDQFRNHYLASPLRRGKVKFAMGLRETLEPASAVAQPNVAYQSTQRNWLSGLFAIPAFQWGVAIAGLVILVGAGWLVVDNLRLRRQIAQSQTEQSQTARRAQALQDELNNQRGNAAASEDELAQLRAERPTQTQPQKSPEASLTATLLLTPQMRGAEQIPSVRIEPTTKSVAAHLTLDPNDFSSYRVALIEEANHRTIWSSGILRARTKGDSRVLTVALPTDRLKSSAYALRVSGMAEGGAPELISDYPFKIVK